MIHIAQIWVLTLYIYIFFNAYMIIQRSVILKNNSNLDFVFSAFDHETIPGSSLKIIPSFSKNHS